MKGWGERLAAKLERYDVSHDGERFDRPNRDKKQGMVMMGDKWTNFKWLMADIWEVLCDTWWFHWQREKHVEILRAASWDLLRCGWKETPNRPGSAGSEQEMQWWAGDDEKRQYFDRTAVERLRLIGFLETDHNTRHLVVTEEGAQWL